MRVHKIRTDNNKIFNSLFTKANKKSDSFVLSEYKIDNSYEVSFGKKSANKKIKTEKEKKQEFYKVLKKQGCKEKAINEVLNNNKKYQHMQELIKLSQDGSTFTRELQSKELLIAASNGFSNEQVQRLLDIQTTSPEKISRRLSLKEAEDMVINNFDDSQIQRYIDLRNVDNEGKTLLSRALTPKEARDVIINEMDDIQANVYIKLLDSNINLYVNMLEFASDKNNISRFLALTKPDENGKTHLSKVLDEETAIYSIVKNYSDERIQRIISLQDVDEKGKSILSRPLNSEEALIVVEKNFDDIQAQRFIDVKSLLIDFYSEKESERIYTNIIWHSKIDILTQYVVSNNLDDIQAIDFVSLQNHYYKEAILDIMNDEEKYSYYKNLTRPIVTDENPNPIVFSPEEAIFVVKNGLKDEEAYISKKMMELKLSTRTILQFLKDEPKKNRFLLLLKGDEKGIPLLSRYLSAEEAYCIVSEKCSDEIAQEMINIVDKNPEVGVNYAITLADFEDFKYKKSINELNLREKKMLLKKMVKYNASLFTSNLNEDDYPIIPKSKKEYCDILPKLANSIGINTKELSLNDINSCMEGIENLIQSIKSVDVAQLNVHLNYSRDSFISDVEKVLFNLSKAEKHIVMNYFGFEVKNNQMAGYPICVEDDIDFYESNNENVKTAIKQLVPFVKKFSEGNNIVIPQNKKLENSLNKIINALPELRTIVEKKQHFVQAYSLDLHTLKVVQNIVLNPQFNLLVDEDKKTLILTALLHDIAKKEATIDKTHPQESAFDAFYIIQKLNLPESQQLKIYELIKAHDWLEKLNKADEEHCEIYAQDIAFEMRHSNTFKLSKILCEADLKSVKKDSSFFIKYQNAFSEMGQKVANYLKKLQATQIFLPQTKIPKASELKNVEQVTCGEITNKVIYLNSKDNDLEKLGFEKGTTVENLRVLVHGLDTEQQLQTFTTFSLIDSDALLSSSYITSDRYKVFRPQGLILDVNPNDIHAGYCRDFGSGFKKNIELIKRNYLFHVGDDIGETNPNKTNYRTYIPNLIKQEMGITDDDYMLLIKNIQNCKSITDIEKKDKNFANALINVFEQMKYGTRRHNREYNEILVSHPKIQAVFAYGQSYQKIPLFLKKYAQDNDLPVIIFGNN